MNIKTGNRGIDQDNLVTDKFYHADPNTFNVLSAERKDGQRGNLFPSGSITVDDNPTNRFFIAFIPAKDSRITGSFVWIPPFSTGAVRVEHMSGGKKREYFVFLHDWGALQIRSCSGGFHFPVKSSRMCH